LHHHKGSNPLHQSFSFSGIILAKVYCINTGFCSMLIFNRYNSLKMIKLIVLATVLILASCDNDKPPDLTDIEDSAEQYIAAPITAPYFSAFETGDTILAKLVCDLWKDRETAGMSHPDFFADSVTCNFLNGEIMRGNRDNINARNKERLSFGSVIKNEVQNMVSLKVKDKGEDRVIVWGKEWITKNGRTDSVELVEDWYIKNGKVSGITQYGRKTNP
jgi:hypothetical protein